MKYVGLTTQQRRNNFRSLLLVVMFPLLVIGLTYVGIWAFVTFGYDVANSQVVNQMFVNTAPVVFGGVLLWFLIAYFINSSLIQSAVQAKPLERKENMRIYNLVENLCMSTGMKMPKVNVIEDPSLNAFASGLSDKTYTVTLTRGIINRLNDDELEGVIAHELAHIRNRDVRLLVISIVFVGIFAMIAQIGFRSILWGGAGRRRSNDNKGVALMYVVIILIAVIGYFLSMLMRFAISRKREYLADAAAAEMTKKPLALASALRKISGNSNLQKKAPDDVAQLFIEHAPQKAAFASIFATHPPIQKRIAVLEQF
ncbi:MAG: M48 family metallopeptidase [Dysgonamonadaceae bacterium]|nr:M48 family metallopeptidase [Dysgonamonadaceae bacterium]